MFVQKKLHQYDELYTFDPETEAPFGDTPNTHVECNHMYGFHATNTGTDNNRDKKKEKQVLFAHVVPQFYSIVCLIQKHATPIVCPQDSCIQI